ncbi:MAG TPA: cytochrome c [Methylococcaceae bacterium]|jgi:cytochrome c553|nr:cytochrome c [Methylococcaceae bacterium]
MRGNLCYSALLAVVLAGNAAWAANPEAGKTTATGVCAGCHGPKGLSATGMFPNLAGQKEEYLAKQLKAFREKTRVEPTMNGLAASLKDEDIANLAAYFAGLKPCE